MGLSCLGLSGFLGLRWLFPSTFSEVFSYYLLEYLLMAFLFVFFFWDSYDSNVGAFHNVSDVPEVVLISFNSFFFFPLYFIYFYHSIFYLTYPVFCLLFYCWFPPECFLSHLLHYSFLIDSFLFLLGLY